MRALYCNKCEEPQGYGSCPKCLKVAGVCVSPCQELVEALRSTLQEWDENYDSAQWVGNQPKAITEARALLARLEGDQK